MASTAGSHGQHSRSSIESGPRAERGSGPRPLTRARILEKAARAFNRRGYHGTKIDEVARALGVTKAALYYHVRSKEELLFECYRAAIEIGLEGIRRARAHAVTPDQQLRLAIAHYVENITDELRGSAVLGDDGALSPEHRRQVVEWRDEFEGELRRMIARGIADGIFVPCDPKLVGFAILGAANWISRWYDPEGNRSGKQVAEAFSAYLVRGLERSPAPDALSPLPGAPWGLGGAGLPEPGSNAADRPGHATGPIK